LHINVDKKWRGNGIGIRLMKVYLDQLTYLKVSGVHLGTSSENLAACQLYEKLGSEQSICDEINSVRIFPFS